MQNTVKGVYEKEMLQTQSLTHELLLNSQNSIGVDEQSAKVKLEQRIMVLNDIKTITINEKNKPK